VEIPKINKEIEIILFNSTPFSVNTEPLKCLIKKVDCVNSKKTDWERRDLAKLNTELINLKKKHKNLNVFNSYDILCPETNCPIYNKEKDILYYIDNNHLSMEGARQLKSGLLTFFKVEYSNLKF
jgi:lysophospholipase L1-like esterase